MKRNFTKMMAALALLVFMMPSLVAWGQTRENYQGTFTRISSADDFVTGYYVVTPSQSASTTNKALGNAVDGNKRITGVEVTLSNNQIVNPVNTVVYYIEVNTNDDATTCSFKNVSTGKYMYQASTTSGKGMGFSDNLINITLAGYNSESPKGFKFTLNGTSNNFLKWNNGSSWYANYANDYTTAMAPVELFKLESTPSTDPFLSVNSSSIDFGSVATNPATPYEESFEVSFANLTQDLTVSVGSGLTGVEVSPNVISKTATSPQTITVSYNPTAVGEMSGDITVSNTTDNVNATVAVTGSAYDPDDIVYYSKVATAPSNWASEYIFTAYSSNKYTALTGVSNQLGTCADIEVVEEQIAANSTIQSYEVTVEQTTNGFSLHMAGGYLYSINDNKLCIAEEFTESICEWTLEINNGLVTITNVETSRAIKYNSSNPRFACYTSGQTALTLFKKVNANQVSTPTFNPAAGTYTQAQSVELNCATEGATIQYKTTENGDWQTYSDALTISETTTVWAKATKEGMDDSDEVSATYTINLPLSTIPAIFNAATSAGSNVNVTFGNWVVSGVSGSNVYVTDNNGNGFIVYKSGHGFVVNNKLSGTVYETPLKLYNGSAEFTNLTSSTEGLTVSTDGEITVITNMTIAELGGLNTGAVITLSDLTYNGTNLSDGTNTIKPYNSLYSGMSFTTGKTYNVTGVYLQFGDTKEILPRSADDIEELAITTPVINASNIEIAYDATGGEIEIEISNPTGATLTATTDSEWLSVGTVSNTAVAFSCSANEGNADRTATVTLSYDGAADKTVTVTQKHFVADYATLPFAFDGGRADIQNTPGLTQEHLGTDYSASPKLKFNNDKNTISTLVLKINERPGTLSFDIKGNSFSGGTFKVQTSEDGTTYTDLKTYTELGDTQNEEFFNLGENVHYIKWIYTTKSSGNVALGNIKLDKFGGLTINGYGTSTNGGYYLIASPVNVENPSATVAGMTTGDFDLYYFDQTQGEEWRNYRANTFSLDRGKGYLYANKNTVTLVFTDEPVTGTTMNVGLVYDADTDMKGYNLIGNPFTQKAYIGRDFYVMNAGGTEIEAANRNYIKPMEGVFVIAADANDNSVTFSTTAPSGKGESIALNLSRANRGGVSTGSTTAIDRAIVRFDEGQQLPKFQLFENSTKLYIPQGNNDFAVVRSAAEGEMPVNFRAAENGTYTINVDVENMEMDYLHLIDNMTGADVDLLATPSYTFEATTRDYASRFKLVFSANEPDGPSTGSGSFAYFNGSEWQISNMGEATLQVIDVTGRIVKNETISGNASISINEVPGVYVMRLVNGENVKTQKIVVK